MSSKVIVSIGSLEQGYFFTGPFVNAIAAEEWIEVSQFDREACQVINLGTPAEL